MQPTDKQIKWFWGQCLEKSIEMRGGYWDECDYFCEMESNPYNSRKSITKLCYLVESRDLTADELDEYQKGFDEGIIKRIPTKAEFWEPVPELDLNNLFKYAVPMVKVYCLRSFGEGHKLHHASAVLDYNKDKWTEMVVHTHNVNRTEDPALALFWAIFKALGGDDAI